MKYLGERELIVGDEGFVGGGGGGGDGGSGIGGSRGRRQEVRMVPGGGPRPNGLEMDEESGVGPGPNGVVVGGTRRMEGEKGVVVVRGAQELMERLRTY